MEVHYDMRPFRFSHRGDNFGVHPALFKPNYMRFLENRLREIVPFGEIPFRMVVRARRRWDPRRGISEEVLRWRGPHGEGEKRHRLRIRSAAELEALTDAAGLQTIERLGGWGGEPFEGRAPRLILLARSRAE